MLWPTSMKTLVMLVAAIGCSKKPDETKPDNDSPKPVEAALLFEPMKIVSDKVIVEAQAPKGWSKTELTPNDHSYADPKGGMSPSTVTISATCPGECAPNRLADLMISTQKSAGYEAKVTKSTEVSNGIEIEIDVTKQGSDPLYQYVRFIYDAALPTGAQCMVLGTGTDAKAKRDSLKAACAKLTLKAK